MARRYVRVCCALVAVLLLGNAAAPPLFVRADMGDNVVKLSPVRQSITISPGKSGKVLIHATNPTGRNLSLRPIIDDFTARDSSGTPSLIMNPAGPDSGRSFKRLVQPLSDVTVRPGGEAEVKLAITVPADAAPGGYYGAVRFIPLGGGTNPSLNLQTSVASLILLKVPGSVKEELSLTSFQVTPPALTVGDLWFGAGKIKAAVNLANSGDVHEAPVGQIYLKQGGAVIDKKDFNHNEPRSYILPGSSRSWQFELSAPNRPGRYTIGAVFTYGSKNQTIEVHQAFWVIPPTYLAGGACLLAAGLLIVGLLLRRVSRRSRVRFDRR